MNKQPQKGGSQNQQSDKQNQGFQNGAPGNKDQQDQSTKINPTNRDNKITNNQNQNRVDEDVEENSIPSPSQTHPDDGSREINTPVYEPDTTEEKIPRL